jgi:type VI secretion system protein ImpF
MPLFDRLGGGVDAAVGGLTLDAGALQHSLQGDLARLFNVRNGLTVEQFLNHTPTVLDYGLPDTLGMSPQSATDLRRWRLVLLRGIALYEPRLSQVQVTVAPDAVCPMAARVTIAAVVALGRQLCQVHFDVVLDDRAARLAVAA